MVDIMQLVKGKLKLLAYLKSCSRNTFELQENVKRVEK